MAGRSKHVTCLSCEIPEESKLRNLPVEVLEKNRDNMFYSVDHLNPWVPHGHNLSGILYVGTTIKHHKVNNYCIGIPLGVPFLNVLDYRKDLFCNLGSILIIYFFTMASKINNVEHNRLSIYSGAQNINQGRCHDGGPIPKDSDPINSGIGRQHFDTLCKVIIVDIVEYYTTKLLRRRWIVGCRQIPSTTDNMDDLRAPSEVESLTPANDRTSD